MINKITENLENFHYNVLIANLHEIYNFLIKNYENDISQDNLKENFVKILKIINPVLPHLSSECLADLNLDMNNKINWPKVR